MRIISRTLGVAVATGGIVAAAAAPALADCIPFTKAAACTTESVVGSGARATLTSCTDAGTIRVTGQLQSTADDGECTRLTVRIGRYSDNWTVCGESENVDTGYQTGTSATYSLATI
ncbi:hypothetical protein [Streptomyces sp. B8F3]|uniref:hypothetical protein n=1 Tax=unclassified Streptomyces TaxID=2593676 RepID=UPI00325D5F5A